MSANTHTTETTTERKPPTIADIVREKTGDGRLIIDFFTDVMTGRIEGAELCHRIDAAKQLVKYGSKDAAEFIAKYKGVPCGHSINGRPDPADPCPAEERSLVAVTLNAPPTLTRDFLTVLSRIDEFLMARLIRAQTADGVTIIEFLDDVMQDRTDGFKTHHRIAAAKELIAHIVRDEQPSHTPSPSTRETDKRGDSTAVGADPCVRPLPGSQTPSPSTGEGWGEGDSYVVPAQAEGNPDNTTVVPAEAGTQGRGGGRSTAANSPRTEPVEGSVRAEPVLSTAEGSAHPNPSSSVVPANTIVVPAKAGTQGGGGDRNTAANSTHPEPARRTPGRQSKTAPDTTDPNTTPPGRKRQGRHSQKGPGVRAHRGGKGRNTRTRGAHPRRA